MLQVEFLSLQCRIIIFSRHTQAYIIINVIFALLAYSVKMIHVISASWPAVQFMSFHFAFHLNPAFWPPAIITLEPFICIFAASLSVNVICCANMQREIQTRCLWLLDTWLLVSAYINAFFRYWQLNLVQHCYSCVVHDDLIIDHLCRRPPLTESQG